MKKIKPAVLSVLLFAFTFFVVHDYVMVALDADTQYELCYAQADDIIMDLTSQIHDDIHILSASLELQEQKIEIYLTSTKPYTYLRSFNSHTRYVLLRPPLS